MKLRFENINKYFDDFHVLKDISFEVDGGRIFGYLGRNGAGKTTSIRILMDVFEANEGNITLDGEVFDSNKHKIGYLPEERGMYSKTTVKDQLVYFAMLRGATRQEAMTSVNYWTQRFEVDHYLNRKLETLSKGNQQKIQITQAFLNEPDILILDEPFSGLDPVNSQLFQDALIDYKREDRLIIFSSHQMSYVETFCDDIAIIDAGQIVLSGELETIKTEIGGHKVRIREKSGDLESYLNNNNIPFEKDSISYILELDDAYSQKDLVMGLLQSDIELDLLSSYKPSLHEIFVSKVGDSK